VLSLSIVVLTTGVIMLASGLNGSARASVRLRTLAGS